MSMNMICTAVIPVAGLGTRLMRDLRRYNLPYVAAQAKIDELMA